MRLRLPRRRPRTINGIELRISTPNGVVAEADSEHLHYMAKYGDGEWMDLIAGNGHGTGLGDPSPHEEFSTVPVKIQIRSAVLTPIEDRR